MSSAQHDLERIADALPGLRRAVAAAADAQLGLTPLVRERSGGSAGYSDPTATIALDTRAARARDAYREAMRAIHAAAVAVETAQYALNAAWTAADVAQAPPSYAHLPPTRRAELDELAELNSRATSVVLSRGV
jgi:hypothetical protein